MTDRHHNRIEFIFDDRGRPTAVEHSAGYRIKVRCDGARILGYRLTAGLDGIPVDQQLCTFDYHQAISRRLPTQSVAQPISATTTPGG